MSSHDFSRTAAALRRLEQDLSRLVQDARKLGDAVKAEADPIGQIVHARVAEAIETAFKLVRPWAQLLASAGTASPTAASSQTSRRRRSGVRGKKANLTADQIQGALSKAAGIKSRAARILGVSVVTFNKYLQLTRGATTPVTKKKTSAKKAKTK